MKPDRTMWQYGVEIKQTDQMVKYAELARASKT